MKVYVRSMGNAHSLDLSVGYLNLWYINCTGLTVLNEMQNFAFLNLCFFVDISR